MTDGQGPFISPNEPGTKGDGSQNTCIFSANFKKKNKKNLLAPRGGDVQGPSPGEESVPGEIWGSGALQALGNALGKALQLGKWGRRL